MKLNFCGAGRFKKRLFYSVIVIAVAAAMAPLTARAQIVNTKVSGGGIRNVVILPAKVDIVRNTMKGPEGMAAESEELSAKVEKTVADVLAEQKKVMTLSGPVVSSDDGVQAKYTVADIQAKFDDLLPKVMKKRGDVKEARFTMGDEVLNLNLDKRADAIVFIRGQGQKLSSGKKTFNILVGGTPAYLRLQIAVVDAHSGEILVYTDPVFAGDPTTANDRLRKALEKAFKKLPTTKL